MNSILITMGVGVVALILFILLFKAFWKVAGTNEVLIVSGLGKVKTRTGGGIFVLPILQKVQRMTLENIQVDFTSRQEIPTKDAIHVLVDAVANMSISVDPARQAVAASKFAGYNTSQIRDIVIPVLEGNIREIISQTQFEDLIRGDKKLFAERIQENVTPNLADMGHVVGDDDQHGGHQLGDDTGGQRDAQNHGRRDDPQSQKQGTAVGDTQIQQEGGHAGAREEDQLAPEGVLGAIRLGKDPLAIGKECEQHRGNPLNDLRDDVDRDVGHRGLVLHGDVQQMLWKTVHPRSKY